MWLIDSRLRLLRLASLLVAIPRLYIYHNVRRGRNPLFHIGIDEEIPHFVLLLYIIYILLFYFPLLLLSSAPPAHILHYDWLDDPTGVT